MSDNFWDHNPSEEELKTLFGAPKYARERLGEPPHYLDIAELYFIRGDLQKAAEYAQKAGYTWGSYIANFHFDEAVLQ